ncbi:MAG TPA: tRNA preQ1(34) S-adenosylmethionine ribosyltransferase-isomerase QueA [Chloroflexia bacterium]|nr:tRNA preQ1(34) S-adenosylmethionine ribosyltransferase-isomerase QueA [Chloroflexia bacterium]
MRTRDFDYDLPAAQIAQTPAQPRDSSRLLVVPRAGGPVAHQRFTDILTYLAPGDLLVANESRVLPARLFGHKSSTSGRVEALLLRPAAEQPDADGGLAPPADGNRVWEALVKPGRSVRPGIRLVFSTAARDGRPGPPAGAVLEAEVVGRTAIGGRLLRFDQPPEPWLEKIGVLPLPPYIHTPLADPERYQTVYARVPGSAAAPTAGLHFTPRLLAALRDKGIGWATVTLHIGLDTFRPVQEDDPRTHPMHREWYELPAATAAAINAARAAGRRVVVVGTTTVRVLETVAQEQGLGDPPGRELRPAAGWSQLFIYPGFHFRVTDGLVTNFHLPRSTLLMLVSALVGRERLLAVYAEAVHEGYRFYSFGDAMLIL